jgi:tetrathionate reductase subunit B
MAPEPALPDDPVAPVAAAEPPQPRTVEAAPEAMPEPPAAGAPPEPAAEAAAEPPAPEREAEPAGAGPPPELQPAGTVPPVGPEAGLRSAEIAAPAHPLPVAADESSPEPAAGHPCAGDGTCDRPDCTCEPRSIDRRRFLGFALTIAAGVAGAAALSQLAPLFAESESADPNPITPVYDPELVAWTFIVDSNRCIGCGLCVSACKNENNLPDDGHYNRTWVERYVETADGAVVVDSPDGGIHGFPPITVIPGVAAKQVTSAFFAPRLCMQCAEPPCVDVCPVSATYITPEGIVLVDDARCIGCAYCIVACPYGARYLIPATERTPLGIPGVADKCTWCYHRIARGLVPACVEVCPVGARKFGDRSDPSSEVAAILRKGEASPLWPEYGTEPRLYYLGPVTETA